MGPILCSSVSGDVGFSKGVELHWDAGTPLTACGLCIPSRQLGWPSRRTAA
jgi:hypothetical protein